jgi:hypothetical protein
MIMSLEKEENSNHFQKENPGRNESFVLSIWGEMVQFGGCWGYPEATRNNEPKRMYKT